VIIDTEKIKQLLESDVTGYQIAKNTGIQEIQISKLRNDKVKLENITLDTAEKLMKFIKEHEMQKIEWTEEKLNEEIKSLENEIARLQENRDFADKEYDKRKTSTKNAIKKLDTEIEDKKEILEIFKEKLNK